jgi:hypothetical protein
MEKIIILYALWAVKYDKFIERHVAQKGHFTQASLGMVHFAQ